MPQPPIVILGAPRSGTTWVQDVLGSCQRVRTVSEPDNETRAPWALVAKAGLGRFPFLRPGERAPRYDRLWRAACCGGGQARRVRWALARQQRWPDCDHAEAACDPARRLGLWPRAIAWIGRPGLDPAPADRILVKSVHACLCPDWVVGSIRPAILVLQRDPFEVAASWLSMAARTDDRSERLEYAGRPERILSRAATEHLCRRYGPIPEERARAVTWLAAALMCELRAFAVRHPDAVVVDFDEACGAPRQVLAGAAAALGLRWTPRSEGILAHRNQPGAGWSPMRETARVPGSWRRRLDPEAAAEIDAMLGRFELLEPRVLDTVRARTSGR